MIKFMRPSYRSLSEKAKSSWFRNQRQCFALGYTTELILKISRWASPRDITRIHNVNMVGIRLEGDTWLRMEEAELAYVCLV
jgi:hypothetical protein